MFDRMRYVVYPVSLFMLFAVSGLWEVPLNAYPAEGRLNLAQFNRRDRRPGDRQMRKMAEQRFEELCQYLELTEEQKKQARGYFDDRQKNTREVFEAVRSGELDRQAARDSMAVLMEKYQDQIKSLLTEEQKVKLEEWMNERRERRGRRPGGALFENLTPDQREQLAELRKARRESLLELRDKLRSGELERGEFRKVLQQENHLFKSSVGEILTEEQLQQFLASRFAKGRALPGKTALKPGGRLPIMRLLPRLKQKLKLSEEQVESLRRLAESYRKRFREIIRSAREEELTRSEVRQNLANLSQRVRNAIGDLLTPDQNEQLTALLEKFRRAHKPRVPLLGLLGRLGQRLELDENQLAEIRRLAEPYREQVIEIFRSAREEELTRDEVRQRIEPLVNEFREAVRAILTEEQNVLLDSLLAERRKLALGEPGDENDSDSDAELTGNTTDLPGSFELTQNSPNPFNPSTTIYYSVPVSDQAIPVNITVYDLRGNPVVQLVNRVHQPGNYSVVFDGRDAEGRQLTSGVYFYRIKAGNFTETRKMVLLK